MSEFTFDNGDRVVRATGSDEFQIWDKRERIAASFWYSTIRDTWVLQPARRGSEGCYGFYPTMAAVCDAWAALQAVTSAGSQHKREDALMAAPTLAQQGDAFREARIALGMTQTELAYRLGFADATLRRWEAGTRRVHPAATNLMRYFLRDAGLEATLLPRLP